ncbi:MAG: trypsin-like peptidase domain-containing protein [Alphaproteobacteria bacterium]|nr:trypsin-like peptidase domain-containing protein [Alphaproteobacteria bacterium]
MILLALALGGPALAEEPPRAHADAAVVHLRVKREATALPLARTWAWLGVAGPGRGGVHTGTGAGVVVADPPGVVTCLHVVAGARSIQVLDAEDRELAVLDPQAIRAHAEADLAWLPLAPDAARTPVVLGDGADGEVTLVGFPGDHALERRAGTVTGRVVRALPGSAARELLLVDAPVARGMSGGPALDAQGRLVGIVQAGSSEAGELGGAGLVLPVDDVRTLLAQAHPPPPSGTLDLLPVEGGWRVQEPGEGAWLGLRAGDVLERVDGAVARREDGVAVLLPPR